MNLESAALQQQLEAAGFRLAGGFHPGPGDGVPPLPDDRPTRTLLLVGNAGPGLWRRIREAPEARHRDPFESYTRRVIGELAER